MPICTTLLASTAIGIKEYNDGQFNVVIASVAALVAVAVAVAAVIALKFCSVLSIVLIMIIISVIIIINTIRYSSLFVGIII